MKRITLLASLLGLTVALCGCPPSGLTGKQKMKAGTDLAKGAVDGAEDLVMISVTNLQEDGTVDLAADGSLQYCFTTGDGAKVVTFSQGAPAGVVGDYQGDTSALQAIDADELQDSDALAEAASEAGASFPSSFSVQYMAMYEEAPLVSISGGEGQPVLLNAYTGEEYDPAAAAQDAATEGEGEDGGE